MVPEVPADWGVESLGSVAEVLLSSVDKKSAPDEVPVRLCNYMDVYSNGQLTSDLEFMEATATPAQVARFRLLPGDVLITKDSEDASDIAVPSVVLDSFESPVVCGYHLAILRPKNIDGRYLCWALRSSVVNNQFVRRANGSTRFGLTSSVIRSAKVPLPPVVEQTRIAAILSIVDEAIGAARKVIEQTKRLKQGLLQTLMTRGIGHTRFKKTEIGEIPEEWRLLRLDEVARVQTGLAKNSRIEGPLRELPYLRVANVQDGHLDLSDVKAVGVPEDRVERYLLMPGDVLLTEGGDYDKLGRGHVWEGQISPCIHQNHVFAVRADHSELLPEFLTALTSSSYGKRYFLGCAKQTTNLASINSTQLRSFPVLLPSLAEQAEIVQRIRAVDAVRNTSAKESERLTRFKQGLLQDLLTGRVRVPLD